MLCMWSSILLDISTMCLLRRCVSMTTSTGASIHIPISIQPTLPVISISLPDSLQTWNQKDVSPFCTSDFEKSFAMSLYFKSFFHIHEHRVKLSLTVQIDPHFIKYQVTHWTHRDTMRMRLASKKNFKLATLFTSAIDFNPKPPSSFGKIQSLHATFAFFALSFGLNHRNTAQSRFISWTHFWAV